jgi:tetratricopeptide (TPR) repeat protein
MLSCLGYVLTCQNYFDDGLALLDEAMAVFRTTGDEWGTRHVLGRTAIAQRRQGNFGQATTILETSLVHARRAGATSSIGWALRILGQTLQDQHGEPDRIRALCEESLAIFRQVSDYFGVAQSLVTLGKAAHAQGNFERAHQLFEECLRLCKEMHTGPLAIDCLVALGSLFREQDRFEQALLLLSAASALNTMSGEPYVLSRSSYESDIASARIQLNETIFAARWAQGQIMTLDQAIIYALDRLTSNRKSGSIEL